ncbi:MAG TPA: YncE family protein [Kofleriaceae bacterium]|jgi:DNA-binding beta-propeller fold protein YncE|nr:YncE family protein [Kofleriaceae bacterium]
MHAIRTIVWPLVYAAGAACSAGVDVPADFGGDSGGASPGCLASNECPTGWTCNDFHTCMSPAPGTDGGVPSETEIDLGAPASSQRYVYVAMTAQNKLARIDGETLAVSSTPVGAAPREIATIPGSDGAVVLDSVSGTATVVRPVLTGGDGTRVLATLPSLNRIAIDPTGQFAVIWFDLVKAVHDHTGNAGSFQDVVVVALAPGHEKAVALTVGFRPRAVAFDAAGTRAYAITEDGVSVIDLVDATEHEPRIVPPIPVADPGTAPEDVEVQIVATGGYAAVRQAGHAGLRIVSMRAADAGQAWDIPLASPPTDIDLAPDGARVYAVLREAQRLAIIDVPGDALDPAGVETVDLAPATIGSLVVSADGQRALLYTNATLDPHLTLVELDRPGFPHVTWSLEKAVRALGISPDSTTAIVLAAKAPGDPQAATSIDDYIAKSYGYALVDLATGFAKLQLTPVDPGPFAYAPDGTSAYVALDGGDAVTATRALQVVATRTGVVETLALGSPPSGVGIVPGAHQAFVAQRHPLGRISFIALVTGAVRTVTGFDLNSQIVDH